MVPFHLSGHKPIAVKRAAFGLKLRLQVAGMGALVVLLGMFRLSRGVLSVNNVYAMPVASGAVVAFGGILLLFAVIPTQWIEKTASWLLSLPANSQDVGRPDPTVSIRARLMTVATICRRVGRP